MPELILPHPGVHASFLTAMNEFRADGRGGPDDTTMLGREIYRFSPVWDDPVEFTSYTDWLRTDVLEESPRPAGQVPATTMWWADEEDYLGRLTIRHRLNSRLLGIGGHIGYDVRPSGRRRGHATAMLAAALPVARGLGIDSALIICAAGNTGSRKVIEANGGVLEDVRDGRLRFWAPTS